MEFMASHQLNSPVFLQWSTGSPPPTILIHPTLPSPIPPHSPPEEVAPVHQLSQVAAIPPIDPIWSQDGDHHLGQFSFAGIQANSVLADQSQLDLCSHGTFVGVYDSHGGGDLCSRFMRDYLFSHVIDGIEQREYMCEEVITEALATTESDFKQFVEADFCRNPLLATEGACCVIGIIWKDMIYVANLGDSQAVLGSLDPTGSIVAKQLSKVHNVSREEIRDEIEISHKDVDHLLVKKHGVWQIKGLIQVSRSIGDVYLKDPRYRIPPEYKQFQVVGEPIRRDVLSAQPATSTRSLACDDRFLIFASDGLWEQLSPKEAVELVHNNPAAGIAKRLIHEALGKTATVYAMTYETLMNTAKGKKREFHDDMTVVVIFLNHNKLNQLQNMTEVSVKGFSDYPTPSTFRSLRKILNKGPIDNKSGPVRDVPGTSCSNICWEGDA